MKYLAPLLLLVATPAYADIPSPMETCDQALAVAGLDGDIDVWSTRSRLRHLLPDVEFEANGQQVQDLGDQYREQLAPLDDGSLGQKTLQTTTNDDANSRVGVRVRARFRLGGLIYDPDEIRAEVVSRDRAAERSDRCAHAVDLYFQWWRTRNALNTNQTEESSDELQIDEAQARARIDALTEGWFSVQLKRKPQ